MFAIRKHGAALKSLTYENPQALLDWAAAQVGRTKPFNPGTKAIGILNDGELCAVVYFDRFDEVSTDMHITTDGRKNWASRDILAGIFAYPFLQLGLRRINALIPANNKAALKNAINAGFIPEGMMRFGAADGGHLSILGMLREECPWLPLPDGEAQ